jgi:hypothetical protein
MRVLFLTCRLPAARLLASLDAHRCAETHTKHKLHFRRVVSFLVKRAEPSFAKTGSGRSCTIYIGKLIKGVSIFIYYSAGDITVDEVSGHPSIDLSSLEGDIELLLPSDAFRSETNETKHPLFLFLCFGVLFTLSCVLCEDRTNARSTLPRWGQALYTLLKQRRL